MEDNSKQNRNNIFKKKADRWEFFGWIWILW
jgi:hypothetical protein